MTRDDTPTTHLPQRAPSPADIPTTALTPEEAEAIGLTDRMTRLQGTAAEDVAPTRTWHAPSPTGEDADGDAGPWSVAAADASVPGPVRRTGPGPDPAAATGAADASAPEAGSEADAVWHGPITPHDPQAAHGPNPSAITWGLVLLLVGALLLAVVSGARIDPLTAGIVILGGTGVALLVAAVLPRGDRDRAVE